MQLARETDIADKLAASGEQRPVLQARERATENTPGSGLAVHAGPFDPRNSSIAARIAATMPWYPVQRHRFEANTSSNASSPISGSRSRTPAASIRKPGVQ